MPGIAGATGNPVTIYNGGSQVTTGNPLPVTTAGAPYGPGVTVGDQLEINLNSLAVGANLLVAAVPGKIIFVTGYNFSLPAADTVSFRSAAAIIGAQGVGVLGGSEAIGAEPYLFKTAAGAALNFNAGLLAAAAGLQVRYRVQV